MEHLFKSEVVLFAERIQSFSQDEIIGLIPSKTLQEIKNKDPHPFFQIYSLCHEGVSTPTILGQSAEPISWPKRAIQSIKNIVTKGVQLFKGHNSDNSTEGRRRIGEVVHSFEQQREGKLHHVFISYHTPEEREEAKGYDICSQEGLWNFFREGGRIVADTIDKLTAIALENSGTEKPAFSGAKRLGFVQAFNKPNLEGDTKMGEETNVAGDVTVGTGQQNNGQPRQIPFKEWLAMKDQFNAYPHQLFSEDELRADRKFGQYFDDLDRLKDENTTLATVNEELKKNSSTEILKLNKQIYMGSAKDRLLTIAKTKGLTDNMLNFVEKSFDTDKETIDDLSDSGLDAFVEKRKDMFQTVMSTMPDIVLPANQSEEDANTVKDPTKASDNEFLDEDFEADDDILAEDNTEE